MEANLSFGAWVRARRRELDLTQEELAEQASCSVEMVKKVEAGRARPSQHLGSILAARLGVAEGEQPLFARWARGGPAPLIDEVSPAGGRGPAPASLPAALTSFVGRTRELSAALALLRSAEVRLVTFTGPGGSGKTRLAREVAALLLAEFPGGAWFVDLAPLTDAGLVVPTIAATLGVRESVGLAPRQALQAYLADRALLLVLDNFEQVAAAAPAVAGILAAAQNVKLLVTSRAALHVPGEREFPVPPLDLPSPADATSPDDLAQNEAVRLFCERAREVKPDFQLTAANAPAVIEIIRRVDGLPLAIELAAAWIKVLPPATLLLRLSNRLNLLSRGAAGSRWALPERQQTLRGAIAWSYELLGAAEQELFRRLAVFAGGCSLEAAEAVAADDALEPLASLVDKSLLLARETPEEGGAARFFMLETIREFGAERLAEHGEEATTRAAHLAWFLELAEQAYAARDGPGRIDRARRLDVEHDNLRAALAWCRDTGQIGRGVKLAGAIGWFWEERGYWREGREWLSALLAMSDSATLDPLPGEPGGVRRIEPLERARALYEAGRIARTLDDSEAIALLQESAQLARLAGDTKLARTATLLQRRTVWGIGDPDAMRSIQAAPLTNVGGGDGNLDVSDLQLQALSAEERGEEDEALALYREALDVARAAGDVSAMAEVLAVLGHQMTQRAEYAAAEAYLQESLALARERGNSLAIADVLLYLGGVADMRGDHDRVARLAEEVLELTSVTGYKQHSAGGFYLLGIAAWRKGELARAAALLQQSLDLRETRGLDTAWQRVVLADILLRLGEEERAAELAAEAEALYRLAGDSWGIALTHAGRGRRAERLGDYERAEELSRETLRLRREANDPVGLVYDLEYLASIAAKRGHSGRAARLFAAAGARREALGSPMPLDQREYCAQGLALARAALGDAGWEEAHAAGRQMTFEQAIEHALGETAA